MATTQKGRQGDDSSRSSKQGQGQGNQSSDKKREDERGGSSRRS
ncbi:MAG: hypothetical protein ACO1O6_07355 [Bacteroidota bacterium]